MSEIVSPKDEEQSLRNYQRKLKAFWLRFGLAALSLLLAIYLFITQQARQNWTTLSKVQYSDLAVDPQGRVWGISSEGIDSFDATGSLERIELHQRLMDNPLSLAFDREGRIWVVAYDAVGMRDLDGEWKIISPGNYKTSGIIEIVVDGQDRVWLNQGYWGDLFFIDPSPDPGATYALSNSGLQGPAISMTVDQNGEVWCVTINQLLLLGTDGIWETRATLPGSSNRYSLAIDSQGLAWVGSGGRVYHLRADNQWTTYLIGNQGVSNSIDEILIDPQGRIWAGSESEGVFMFDGSADWIRYDSQNSGLKNAHVAAMAIDDEEKLWIATYNPLNFFNVGTALTVTETSLNRGNTGKLVGLKNRLPIVAVGVVVVVILGIALGTPKAFHAVHIPKFMTGFVGWFLIISIYWGIMGLLMYVLARTGAFMPLIIIFISPLLGSIITLIVLMTRPHWRWMGVGILSAFLTNCVFYLFFVEITGFSFLELLFCLPFFIPGFIFP